MRFAPLFLLATAQATNVIVAVTCANAPTSFTVNGAENADVNVTAGDVILFDVNCANYTLQVTNSTGSPYLQGVNATNGSVVFGTTTMTPSMLWYSSPESATMKGPINVMPAKATKPSITTVTSVAGLPNLNISWNPGSPGSCIFSSWDILFSGGGVVPGCTNLTNVATTSCEATSLNGSTSYSFTVQRKCTDPLLNSDISIVSSSGTTISTQGIKICQNVDTCNCGNATTCTCQLTRVCNCENAGDCICQGGQCNGGNAGRLICNFPTNCNKQCAKQCPVCIADVVSGFFGGGSSCSDAGMIHASLALLAALFAFSS